MKQISYKVVENGGIVRSIQNHGVREFPHRVQAKYPDFLTQQRYFEKGRIISLYYDASPQTMQQVEKLLSLNDQILRQAHLKARSKLDFITMQRPEKNPYVQKVLRREEQERQKRAAEDMAIATATTAGDNALDTLMENLKDDLS